jgi:hypothetical protein
MIFNYLKIRRRKLNSLRVSKRSPSNFLHSKHP